MKAPRASAVSPHDEHDGADSVERFAAKHDVSRSQVYKEIAAGRLTARKVASRTIITREDAAVWRRALPKAKFNCPGPIVRSTAPPAKRAHRRPRSKPPGAEPGTTE
jgi:hypothetical protein